MNNMQIIIDTAIANNIYTEEEIEEMLENGEDIPFHSFSVWKAMGYVPKKGSHGICTNLWRHKDSKKEDETEEVTEENKRSFYLTKTYLFPKELVEKIRENKEN